MSVFAELWQYREVLRQLAWREIRIRYKQTLLGFAWTIVQPVSLMLLFTIVFTRFVKVDTGPYPYPIFVYCVLLPWGLFSAGLTRATGAITGNANLIQKVYVPRQIFVLISLAPPLVDFAISAGVYVALMAWYRTTPTVHLLWFPALLLMELALIFGVGLWLATFNAFYRDAGSALGLILQLWFYGSPIIYGLSSVPEWLMPYYRLNPLVGLMDGFRGALLGGYAPDPQLIGITLAWCVGLVVTGLLLFRRAEGYFADVL